ncbi:MAG: YcgL domain-containing protein, partial [Pseudomonadales bacterium]
MRSVTIYRSSKRDGMYLYVDRDELLSRVPEELLKRFGRPVE